MATTATTTTVTERVLDDCLCTEMLDGKAGGRVYMNADIVHTELYQAA